MNQKESKERLTAILDEAHEEVKVHKLFVATLKEVDDYLRSTSQGQLRTPLKHVIDHHDARMRELQSRIGIIANIVASM